MECFICEQLATTEVYYHVDTLEGDIMPQHRFVCDKHFSWLDERQDVEITDFMRLSFNG